MLAWTIPLASLSIEVLFRWFGRAHTSTGFDVRAGERSRIIRVTILGLLIGLQTVILGGMLAPGRLWGNAAAIVAGIALILVGNELPRVGRNWIIGVRTPWSLETPAVWWQTQLVAGYTTSAVGILVVIASLFGNPHVGRLLGWGVAASVAISVLYSYAALRRRRMLDRVLLSLSIVGTCASVGRAQSLGGNAGLPASWQAVIDSAASAQMLARGIPGAAIVIVKDGAIVYERGLGLADVTKGVKVDPSRTMFRIASLSKAMVAMAVLQLADQRKLDLKASVQRYVADVDLKREGWRDITSADLLTHTAGFDERALYANTANASSLEPLSQHLARRLPPRVLPPGEAQSYSNYGYALLGLVVERVSRRPFVDYMRDEVLRPLGMNRTTFQQPPQGAFAADVATSYRQTSKGPVARGAVYTQTAPAGGAFATAHDIGRFMLALLDSGSLDGVRVLAPSSVDLMKTAQYTPHPAVWGMTYGLAEYHPLGTRAIIKGGDLGGFNTMMALFPDERLGVFYISNAPRGLDLLDAFAGLVAAGRPVVSSPPPRANSAIDLRRFSGVYRSNRFPRTDVTKASSLLLQFPVRIIGDGTLDRWGTRWVSVEPLLFRRVDRDEYMVFRADQSGRITELHAWNGVFEKLAWYESLRAQTAMMVAFLFAFAVPLVRGLRRTRRPGAIEPSARITLARRLVLLVSALNLTFVVLFVVAFTSMSGGLLLDLPLHVRVLLTLPLFSLAASAGLTIVSGRAFIASRAANADRLYLGGYVVLSCAFLLWLNHWNLVSVPL